MKIKHLLFYFLVLLCNNLYCIDLFWRSSSLDNVYTNIGNWETSPGNGISPSTSPTVNDNVFFTTNSNNTNINLNGGNSQNFNVTVSSSISYNFYGNLNSINGNLNCSNGNATFSNSTINFRGSATHTIDMGTTGVCFTNCVLLFNNSLSSGTYSLSDVLNTDNSRIQISTQSFNTNNYNLYLSGLIIDGNAGTIDFGTSIINISTPTDIGNLSFLANTTYNTSNATINYMSNVNNLTSPVFNYSEIVVRPGTTINLQTLQIYSPLSNHSAIYMKNENESSTSVCGFNLDTFKLNCGSINIGRVPLVNCMSNFGNFKIQSTVLEYLLPTTLYSFSPFELEIDQIIEPNICRGNSGFFSSGRDVINIELNNNLSTNTILFQGVNFTSNSYALTSSSSYNLGLNSGNVSWSSATTGTNFYWVGGNGNWNDPTEWSISSSGGSPQSPSGCVPTIVDNVFFDNNSFSSSQNVNIYSQPAFCNNITWSGSNLGKLMDGAGGYSNETGILYVNGNSDFTGARGISSNLFFVGSGSVTSGGNFVYESPTIKICTKDTISLNDDLIRINSTNNTGIFANFWLTGGTLKTQGYNMGFGYWDSRSLPFISSNQRIIDVRNSEIDIWRANGAGGQNTISIDELIQLRTTNSVFRIHDPTMGFFLSRYISTSTIPTSINFNEIHFTSENSTFQSLVTTGNSYTVSFQTIRFVSNGYILNRGASLIHNVTDYIFGSGGVYTFSTGNNFNVLGDLIHNSGSCAGMITIKSEQSGTQAILNKTTSPFEVDNAMIEYVNSLNTTLVVNDGQDLGNNTNVSVANIVGRKMYWVGGTGNWNDGANHWSIGASGGNPSVNNPMGCIPRSIDDVIFDNNSFTSTGQTVTLNIDGDCRSMVWTSAAGSQNPIFVNSGNRILNIYDSLELATGMNMSYYGRIVFRGFETGTNQNSIRMNNVAFNQVLIDFDGGGRFDFLDSFHTNSSLHHYRGSLYSNGNKLYSMGMYLNPSSSDKVIDFSNSLIQLHHHYIFRGYSLYLVHGGSSSYWNVNNSTFLLTGNARGIFIYNPFDVAFHNVIINSSTIFDGIYTDNNEVTFNKIHFLNNQNPSGNIISGRVETDTLIYPYSSTNLIGNSSGQYVQVNDTLIVEGTPCNPAYIRSFSNGTPSNFSVVPCNMNLNFVNFRDINVATCSGQNYTIGANEGGNTNINFTPLASLTLLGRDTIIACNISDFTQRTNGFGRINGMTYLWQDNSTADTFKVTTNSQLSIRVEYGLSCYLLDTINITFGAPNPILIPITMSQDVIDSCEELGFRYYLGDVSTGSNNRSIVGVNLNGNSNWAYNRITAHNEGNLTGGSGTFSNSGLGYYESNDGSNSLRISKRMYSIVSNGNYTTNGGIIVRVFYSAQDTMAMISDAFVGAGTLTLNGWFKHNGSLSQDVVNSMTPTLLNNSDYIYPIAQGSYRGLLYADFLMETFSVIGYYSSTVADPLPIIDVDFKIDFSNCISQLTFDLINPNNLVNYEIEYSLNGNDFFKYHLNVNIKDFQDKKVLDFNGISDYEFVYYRLKIINLEQIQYSKVFSVYNNCLKNRFNIFPNPTAKNINILNSYDLKYSLLIYDSNGKLIKSFIKNNLNLYNVEGLSNGFYYVIILDEKNVILHKEKLIKSN